MLRTSGRQSVVAAYVATVLLGGFNGIAIRLSNQELAPFWGATVRFGAAAVGMFALVAILRVSLPRGRALTGSVLFGSLSFGVSFALAYWALTQVPPGLAQVVLAIVPLLTLLLAVTQGLERFRWQGAAGAILAVGGVAVIFGDRLGAQIPALPMLAVLGAAFCIAEGSIVLKRFPPCHPLANNAIAMAVGALVLIALSLVAGEPRALPAEGKTWLAIGYLVVVGSIVVFGLYVYVIERWTASATSYILLLMPLVTVPASAVILGESVTPAFLFGGLLVLTGVYVGAFGPSLAQPLPSLARPAVGAPSDGSVPQPPSVATPTCP